MRKILNLAHYFPYDVKLRLLAHSRSFLANEARNAIVGAENLLNQDIICQRAFLSFTMFLVAYEAGIFLLMPTFQWAA